MTAFNHSVRSRSYLRASNASQCARRHSDQSLASITIGLTRLRTARIGRCNELTPQVTPPRPVRRDKIFYGLFDALRAKDPYTAAHSLRVERLANLLCRRIGLDAITTHNVCAAAVLHDIGKLAVPDAVLTKPSRLTNNEFALIKKHPADGESLLKSMPDYRDLLPMIRHHHEWTDGNGYPDGLSGQAIPFTARVIQVSDCVDAMAVSRSYAAARPVVEIIGELDRGAGTQFDAGLAQNMSEMIATEPELLSATAAITTSYEPISIQ